MNKFEQYLVALLQEKIIVDNQIVYVQKQFNEDATLPIITLDTSIGVNTEYCMRSYEDGEKLHFYRNSTININVWCNTESERQSINQQILDCFYHAKQDHYTYCSNYNNGNCSTIKDTCPASIPNSIRSVKGRCIDPDAYEYQNLQTKYCLVHGTTMIEPPFDLDEDDKHPPLLRSILVASSDYWDVVDTGGNNGLIFGYEGIEIK